VTRHRWRESVILPTRHLGVVNDHLGMDVVSIIHLCLESVGYRCSRPEAIGDLDFWPAMFCTEGAVRRYVYLLDVGGGVAQPLVCWSDSCFFTHRSATEYYLSIMYQEYTSWIVELGILSGVSLGFRQ
jgi:hypothetical protein